MMDRSVLERKGVNDRKVDASALSKGYYVLRISTGEAVDDQKFVKEE